MGYYHSCFTIFSFIVSSRFFEETAYYSAYCLSSFHFLLFTCFIEYAFTHGEKQDKTTASDCKIYCYKYLIYS